MADEDFVMSIGPTADWQKLQKRLDLVEKEINSITVQLCDPLDEQEKKRLKRTRADLVKEHAFIIRARKDEPILLRTSFDIQAELEKAKEKVDAERNAKDHT